MPPDAQGASLIYRVAPESLISIDECMTQEYPRIL